MCKDCAAIDRMIFARKGCCPGRFRGVFVFDAFVVFLFLSPKTGISVFLFDAFVVFLFGPKKCAINIHLM